MQESKQIWIVVGTRPNFIKVTQFKRVVKKHPDIVIKLIHTGQHYDDKMARVFFDEFKLYPDIFLNISPSHPALQIAETIEILSNMFLREKPDLVMVVGDVNSTLAAAIAANKCHIPIAHLESGLRSFDRTMPEEHNRILTDQLADLHFVTEDSGIKNLRQENKPEAGIAFVGNTMIDTLVAYKQQINDSTILKQLNLEEEEYALITIHRPSNVDNRSGVNMLLKILQKVGEQIQAVFPIHPRTKKQILDLGFENEFYAIPNIQFIEPLGYFDFQKLVANAHFVLTDSGGIQEETTYLQIPCLTLRPNTERPITIDMGTNVLLPFDVNDIRPIIADIIAGKFKKGKIPKFWDGQATQRVLERIENFFNTGI